MATVKKYNLAGVSTSLELGKQGSYISGNSSAIGFYTSGDALQKIAIANASNDKINNRNDNISRIKMAIEDGSIKDKETPVDGDADAELLDDEDVSSDEEDMDDPTMIDTTTVRDGINKYWLCNGECDDSKATNAGDINWDDNSKKRERFMKSYVKKFEKISEDLNELKVYLTTKDKDILEVQQAADSIKKAIVSNKKQIPAIKLLVKRVEDEKSIIKKYVKSGQMKDERKKNLVFTKKFSKERANLMKKVEN